MPPIPPKTTPEVSPVIMVVDDTPANLDLLNEILTARDYIVRTFPSGRLALAAASAQPPDLILLDIMMPEMNGYAVCERLKSTPALRDIPVLFISALSEASDKVLAFEAGGVDYVTKPFQPAEVEARVATHLELARDRRELEELVKVRTRQLEEAERLVRLENQLHHSQKMEAIGHLAGGIAHEINTPSQFIRNNLLFCQNAFCKFSLLLQRLNGLFERVQTGPGGALDTADVKGLEEIANDADMRFYCSEMPGALSESLQGIERVTGIVRAMKDFSNPGSVDMRLSDINEAIESMLTISRNEWKRVAEVVADYDPNLPMVSCFPDEIKQAILNIIVNAAQAIADVVGDNCDANAKGKITVTTCHDAESVEIRIGDTGRGIPESIGNRVFDLFFTTKEIGKGTGQGLAIAYSAIVKKHHGALAFQTEPGKGTTFIIRLPINPNN